MTDLKIQFEWECPEGARGPELRSTWARLHILVGGQSVTEVEDRAARSVREAIYLPLYPLAEWLAANWWSLLYEIPSPSRIETRGHTRRHVLTAASEGFALPPLRIHPEGQRIALTWEPGAALDRRVRFLGRGSARLERAQVEDALRGFVDAVVTRLEEEGSGETFLRDEWEAIQRAEAEEREFCRAAGALGCDPYALNDDDTKQLIQAVEELPPGTTDEFLATADPGKLLEQTGAITSFIAQADELKPGLESLISLRSSAQKLDSDLPPWEQGYAFARWLRQRLGLDGQPINSAEGLEKALDISPEDWRRSMERRPRLMFLDALVATTRDESPSFAVQRSHIHAQTFTFCRALFEYLSSPMETASLVTASYSERQKRNRAFAAEFLAPAEALRNRVTPVVTEEDLDVLSQEFGTSAYVIRHQIENHGLARVVGWSG